MMEAMNQKIIQTMDDKFKLILEECFQDTTPNNTQCLEVTIFLQHFLMLRARKFVSRPIKVVLKNLCEEKLALQEDIYSAIKKP